MYSSFSRRRCDALCTALALIPFFTFLIMTFIVKKKEGRRRVQTLMPKESGLLKAMQVTTTFSLIQSSQSWRSTSSPLFSLSSSSAPIQHEKERNRKPVASLQLGKKLHHPFHWPFRYNLRPGLLSPNVLIKKFYNNTFSSRGPTGRLNHNVRYFFGNIDGSKQWNFVTCIVVSLTTCV